MSPSTSSAHPSSASPGSASSGTRTSSVATAFHRTPPLLGYLQRRRVVEGNPEARFFSTTAVPLTPHPHCWQALDCHHGRVLLYAYKDNWHLVVWDPVTGDRKRLREPPINCLIYSAAVFSAVSGCDHVNCHGGSFRVVFVAIDGFDDQVKACVYSSETDAWTTPQVLGDGCEVYVRHKQDIRDNGGVLGMFNEPYIQPRRGAVIGDEIYFIIRWGNEIVKYDLGKNCLSMIDPPPHDEYHIALMEMEDSALGFASIEGWNLCLWSRKVRLEGAAEWIQYRVIELEGMIPVAGPRDEAVVVGSAEGAGFIFVATGAGLFTFELESGQIRMLDEPGVYFSILPYMSFYTPDFGKSIAWKEQYLGIRT